MNIAAQPTEVFAPVSHYAERIERYIDLIGATHEGKRDYWSAMQLLNHESALGLDDDALAIYTIMAAGGTDTVQRFRGNPHILPKYAGNSGEHPIFAVPLMDEMYNMSGLKTHANAKVREYAELQRREDALALLMHDVGELLGEFGTVSDSSRTSNGKDIPLTEHRVQKFAVHYAAYCLQEAKKAAGVAEDAPVTREVVDDATARFGSVVQELQKIAQDLISYRRTLREQLSNSLTRAVAQRELDSTNVESIIHEHLDAAVAQMPMALDAYFTEKAQFWNQHYRAAEGLAYAGEEPNFTDAYDVWQQAAFTPEKTHRSTRVKCFDRLEGNFHYQQLGGRGGAHPLYLGSSADMRGSLRYGEDALIGLFSFAQKNPPTAHVEFHAAINEAIRSMGYTQLERMSMLLPGLMNRKAPEASATGEKPPLMEGGLDELAVDDATQQKIQGHYLQRIRAQMRDKSRREDSPLQSDIITYLRLGHLYRAARESGYLPGQNPLSDAQSPEALATYQAALAEKGMKLSIEQLQKAAKATRLIDMDIVPEPLTINREELQTQKNRVLEFARSNPSRSPFRRSYGKPRVYLAGPAVFEPDALEIARKQERQALEKGFRPYLPVDNAPGDEVKSETQKAKNIYDGNLAMMDRCDIVIADMTPFRGTSMDVGTAFEMGYFAAQDKLVVAYSSDPRPFAERVRDSFPEGTFTTTDDGRLFAPDGKAVENFGDLPDNLMMACAAHAHRQPIAVSYEEALDVAMRLWKMRKQERGEGVSIK